ncbi:tetratricopeptide repeat protein [Adhaeribacter swui]|uniref:histidine kinase n=1 Tax=Adhaeribacter swui TaxID=2086471 RepID=A0A7G7GBB9_9BACT|nr:tetratricopeptide repeat protein [Adhaeribacter swui]QNF34453.1 tetratricopeptide repeat protein [Adhaeribacter swui]
MKCITAALFLLLFGKIACAQTSPLDSLSYLISKATSDTAKINLRNKKIRLLIRENLDSAEQQGLQNLQHAQKIKYAAGQAAARINLASSYSLKGNFKPAREHMDIARKLFLDLKDSLGLSNTYATYGMYFGIQGKYDSSIFNLEKAIGIAERNNYQERLATYYGNIAIGYQMQSNFRQALAYQQKSLDLAVANNDVSNQAYTNLNLGLIYASMKDTLRSRLTLLKAIKLAKKEKIKNVELYAYSNLSNLYSEKKEARKAYNYAIIAARLGREMGDYGIQAASLSKAAGALETQEQFARASALAKQAIALADSSGQSYIIFQAYSRMGSILRGQKQYKTAIYYLEKSVNALENTETYREDVGQTFKDLSYCYEQTGNFNKALSYYKTSAQIADSVLSRDNIREVTELSMTYEFNKQQEAQQLAQKNKDAITRTRQWALGIGLALTFVLAVVSLRAYRNKQKANALLQGQKEEIQNTLTRLKSTQAQLIQSEKMASLGELTAGIAHEIQNPLNFVNNFSEVSAELLDELEEELQKGDTEEALAIAGDIKENLKKIQHHGSRADGIVKAMLQHSRPSSGEKKLININSLIPEYFRLAYNNVQAKNKEFNVTFTTDFDNSLSKIEVNPLELGRVLVNIFNNAFYATQQKKAQLNGQYQPEISVSTYQQNGHVEIKVRDNGTGIPENLKNKIFQPFFTTKPTGQGTGLGLSLAYDIVTKQHGGKLKVETKEGEFVEFIVILPIA